MQNNDLLIALGGHIDHGKTSLIKAFNGFDGDKREEEKQRGITLDISFSNLELPSRNIAFIDVPGHEKLVKHMIAGAFSVDLLCLVIASDDGIMPQTLEHLAIANFLNIPRCVCILSKTDKSTQEEIAQLSQDIQALFADLDIQLDCIFPFSLHTQEKDKPPILKYLNKTPKPLRKDIGFFRYYIDRSFHISGAGCVVSGSTLSGEVKKGDKLFVYDLHKEVTIKGLKIHTHFAQNALPSHRVALNLTELNANELKRGYLIAPKGYLRGFDCLDVVLFGSKTPPTYATFHIGAKKTNAKIALLYRIDSHSYFATIKCGDKIFAIFKERFILRNHQESLFGGEILSPITDPLKKAQKLTLLQALLKEDFITAFALLTDAHSKGFGLISSTQRFGLSHAQALHYARQIPNIFVDERNLVLYSTQTSQFLKQNILQIFKKNPQALLSASSLHIKYSWASEPYLQALLNDLLSSQSIQKKNGLYTSLHNTHSQPQDIITDKILSILHQQGYSPLAPYNIYDLLHIDRKVGDQALKKLCASQKIVRLEHNLFITSSHLNQLLNIMRQIIKEKGYIDFALLKEVLPLSRKYLISYLDYLDHFEDIIKIDTKRVFKHTRRKNAF